MCLILAVLAYIWAGDAQDNHLYLPEAYDPNLKTGILTFFTYFLLLNTMIPISLIVSLELVKIA
jgi:hypothetical protein